MKQLENMLAQLFGKLPKLPANLRQLFVQLAPFLTIVGIIMIAKTWSYSRGSGLDIFFVVAILALYVLAVPGLFKRRYAGWQYMFWASIIAGLQSLAMDSLFSFIIVTGLSLYLLFQVRSSYN